MQRHPAFTELVVADDDELGRVLGSAVIERETIHEWPLSWVQRLVLQDGRTLVYKSQLPPTVESAFYRAATSELLAGYEVLGPLGACETMVIDWIDAPLLQELTVDTADLVEHGRAVVTAISRITGDLPVYLDIGSPAKWTAVTLSIMDKLEKLVADGKFASTRIEQVAQVRAWSARPDVAAAIAGTARLVHADLHDDQIFCTADGYRVIDWQRPIIGPAELDLASLLINNDIDPAPYVAPEAITAFWFHRLHWAVEAQAEIFPGAAWPLFDQWSSEAVTRLLALI